MNVMHHTVGQASRVCAEQEIAAPRKPRVLLFDSLSPALVPVARFFAWWGWTVLYVKPQGRLRNDGERRALSAAGVNQFHFASLAGLEAAAADKVLARMSAEIVDRLFPVSSMQAAAKRFPLVQDRERKVRALAYHVVFEAIRPHSLSHAVLEHFGKGGRRCVLWSTGGPLACLLSGQLPGRRRSLVPPMLSVAAQFAQRLYGAVLRRWHRTPAPSQGETATAGSRPTAPLDAQVILFPHKGISDKMFARDQYYSVNPASLLAIDRICHIELADMLPPGPELDGVMESYRLAGIAPHMMVFQRASKGVTRWLDAVVAGRRCGLGVVAAVLLEVARRRVEQGMTALSRFPNARFALLGYEYLFPLWLAYALQAKGLRIAATQERLFHCWVPGLSLIIDDYFVVGEAARDMLRAHPFTCIDRIYPVGDVRTDWITRHNGRPAEIPLGYDHVTLVLDWHSKRDAADDSYLHTNCWSNNRLFYRDIFALAKRFPRSFFIIRGKNIDWLDNPVFEDIRAEMRACPNVATSLDYSRHRMAYDLAAAADSVIARHTSLGDQCLAVGKPVIFHEATANGGALIQSWVNYGPYPVFANDHAGLLDLYAKVVRTGHTMSEAEWQTMARRFYAWPHPPDGIRALVQRKLEDILAQILTEPNQEASSHAGAVKNA